MNAAKAALTEFEAAPATTTPVVPSEAQLRQACASDAELMQAAEQRDAKTRAFHGVLTQAMSNSQTPLTTMLATIDAFDAEVKRHLQGQTDKDVRRELELVLLDLESYREHAEDFARDWDELAPKVAGWKAGGSPDVLIEYQQKAEMLVRELHKSSGTALGTAIRKADAIGRGGAEMTKRRIIQSALMKVSHACDEARTAWINPAVGVIPANNLELKALRNAIRDLTPRIQRRQEYHRQKLVEHLEQVRADENTTRHRLLRDEEKWATQRYQELSSQFLEIDATVSRGDEELQAELRHRRAEIRNKEDEIARLEKEEIALEGGIELVGAQRQGGLAGAVSYARLAAIPANWFSRENMIGAILCGAATAIVVLLIARWVSRPERYQTGLPA
jgi:hypothetical protein